MKLTQNQFHGLYSERELIAGLPIGTTYSTIDTDQLFIINKNKVLSEIKAEVNPVGALDSLQLRTDAGITVIEGQMAWNAVDGTYDIGMQGGNATLQIGQEVFYHVKAAEAIANGDVVYASGTNGASGSIEASKFLADGNTKAFLILGVATEAIASGSKGYITHFGKVRGINTNAFEEGDVLYPSPTVAGALTNVQPISPNVEMPLAFAINSTNNGTISVRLTPPNELAELHDVHLTAPILDNHLLVYDSTAGHWDNKTLSSVTANGLNVGVLEFADNAAALVGTLVIGDIYRTGDLLKIVH